MKSNYNNCIFGSMEDKTNIIQIQRYHSPCGDLMLGSVEDKLCLCDWAAESHRDIVDRRLRKMLKAGYEESTSDVIREAVRQLDEYFDGKRKIGRASCRERV